MEQHFPEVSWKGSNLVNYIQNLEKFCSAIGPFKNYGYEYRIRNVEVSNKWRFLDVEWAFLNVVFFIVINSRFPWLNTLDIVLWDSRESLELVQREG